MRGTIVENQGNPVTPYGVGIIFELLWLYELPK